MATPHELNQWLQEGIAAAKTGQLEQARFRLLDVVEQDQTNETAWYWLYQVFHRKDDKRICLENLIILNPHNQWAKRELLKYLEETARSGSTLPPEPVARPSEPSGRPLTLKLVIAFWAGISLIFLGGGIITVSQWLVNLPTIPGPQSSFLQYLEPALGASFILAGILGLYIAVSLFFQTTLGFYSSIFLALGLLLLGPTLSLIVNPPNYVAMTCIGGISGMIVLLTLASWMGRDNSTPDNNAT